MSIEKLALAKNAKGAKINNKLDHGGHRERQLKECQRSKAGLRSKVESQKQISPQESAKDAKSSCKLEGPKSVVQGPRSN